MGIFSLAIWIGIGVISAIGMALDISKKQDEVMKPSKRPKKEEDEYDCKIVKGVIVSLYTRNVNWFSSSDKSNFTNGEGTDAEHLRHWALVFEFPNTGRVITYEANEVDSHLIWSCKNSAPEMEKGSKFYHDIARCRTSPKKLQEIARNISDNYKPYNMCFRNCQSWVISFICKLEYDVYANIVAKFKPVSEKEPFLSFLVGMGHAVMNVTKNASKSQ